MKKNRILIYPALLIGVLLVLTFSCEKDDSIETGTVTDSEGNIYKTVKIGDQWWMAENLKTTKYSNGDPIPNVTDSLAWENLNTGAYCNFDNDESISTIYGRLYNWYAVNDSRNIAPVGWHIPSEDEWTTLLEYLGGGIVAGGKLKERGSSHWNSPNREATNESGFTALPGGYRSINGAFNEMGVGGNFWSSTEKSATRARYHDLVYYSPASGYRHGDVAKGYGFSVRCIKDN